MDFSSDIGSLSSQSIRAASKNENLIQCNHKLQPYTTLKISFLLKFKHCHLWSIITIITMTVAWATNSMSWVSDIRFAKFSALKILTFSNNKLHFIHESIRTSDNHKISADGAVLYTLKGF